MPKVSYTELELAFSAPGHEYQNWLDKQTGAVLSFESRIEWAREQGVELE